MLATHPRSLLLGLLLAAFSDSGLAWSPNNPLAFGPIVQKHFVPADDVSSKNNKNSNNNKNEDSKRDSVFESRRSFLSAAAMQIGFLGGGALLVGSPEAAVGEDATIYRSGKAPIVPGQKPKDKTETKGTRKEPDFLRSISDCRSQCVNTLDPDGLAKSKEDCLSDCQDICCKTYEQCTFDIVPRI